MVDAEEIRGAIEKSGMTPSHVGALVQRVLELVMKEEIPGEIISPVVEHLELVFLVAKEEWDRIPSHEIH